MYEKKSYIAHFKKVGSGINVLNRESRKKKAQKIIKILEDYHGPKLDNLACLDIGCSTGWISKYLSHKFRKVIAIDTDKEALAIAKKNINQANLYFKDASAMNLPFKDSTFDAVICNHIYEHVPDSKKLFNEIYRVLKKGGICYFSAGNKLKFIESHYKLPFLSWLPTYLSNCYLRLTKKGRCYEEKHLSYFGLRNLIKRFKVKDYTINILKNHKKYEMDSKVLDFFPIEYIPNFLIKVTYLFLPTYIFVLEK